MFMRILPQYLSSALYCNRLLLRTDIRTRSSLGKAQIALVLDGIVSRTTAIPRQPIDYTLSPAVAFVEALSQPRHQSTRRRTYTPPTLRSYGQHR